jgi:hypothetical protein
VQAIVTAEGVGVQVALVARQELRRRTRVVGCFPEGESALMLVGARLRHVAGTKWGTRRNLDMSHLWELDEIVELTEEGEVRNLCGT